MLVPMMMMAAALQASSPPRADPDACYKSDTVKLTPADALQRLDDFRAGLTPSDRARLDRALPRNAADGIGQCDVVEGSRASCEAAAYRPALRATGLMLRFLETICSKP